MENTAEIIVLLPMFYLKIFTRLCILHHRNFFLNMYNDIHLIHIKITVLIHKKFSEIKEEILNIYRYIFDSYN